MQNFFGRPIVVVYSSGQVKISGNITFLDGQPIFVHYNGLDHYDALLLNNHKDNDVLEQLMKALQKNARLVLSSIIKYPETPSIKIQAKGNRKRTKKILTVINDCNKSIKNIKAIQAGGKTSGKEHIMAFYLKNLGESLTYFRDENSYLKSLHAIEVNNRNIPQVLATARNKLVHLYPYEYHLNVEDDSYKEMLGLFNKCEKALVNQLKILKEEVAEKDKDAQCSKIINIPITLNYKYTMLDLAIFFMKEYIVLKNILNKIPGFPDIEGKELDNENKRMIQASLTGITGDTVKAIIINLCEFMNQYNKFYDTYVDSDTIYHTLFINYIDDIASECLKSEKYRQANDFIHQCHGVRIELVHDINTSKVYIPDILKAISDIACVYLVNIVASLYHDIYTPFDIQISLWIKNELCDNNFFNQYPSLLKVMANNYSAQQQTHASSIVIEKNLSSDTDNLKASYSEPSVLAKTANLPIDSNCNYNEIQKLKQEKIDDSEEVIELQSKKAKILDEEKESNHQNNLLPKPGYS